MAGASVSTSSTTEVADHKLPRKEVAPRPGQTELRVGRLTKAHGLKGAIKLELYTDEPEKRFVPGAVFTLQVPTASKWHGKTLELRELRWYNGHPVGFFAGVDDRTEAETLIKEISRLDPANEKWLEMVQKLREALEQHIEKEEEDIWPHIEEVWDRTRLEEAGRQMEGMKSKSAAA